MKKETDILNEFPENTEIWQAVSAGVVEFEHPNRAIVNGYMQRNNLPGRPVMTKVKFDSVYKAGEKPGELAMI